jgi:uncharacterized protein YjdB
MKKFDWKRMLVMAFAMILAVGQLEAAAVDVSAATKKQTLNATKVTLTVGKTKQLKVSNISASKVKWSSSKKSVAMVSKTGKVTAKKKGTATITAKFSGKSLTCKVTVKAKASSATTPTTPTTSDTPTTTTGKTLVVYYSATNSTERVANYIATAANADIFEIEPAEPYTSADLNWTDSSSRVVREYEDTSLRNVALTNTTVENWDSYDTVFIGYRYGGIPCQ